MAGCSTGGAPVIDRSIEARPTPATYTVRKGDTLYSIAWRFDRDYQSLARLNGIGSPYRIYPGQLLKLKTSSTTARPAASTSSSRKRSSTATVSSTPPSAWVWPATGSVQRGYGSGNKGIDIAVTPDTPVVSVAAGEVVYAGGGLRGFRHLVIVKHDSRYLSAYSLNDALRVSEGASVKAGSRLADIRARGTAAVVHFELRRDGKPIDPRSVIRRR
jgi:lipoprotein NlpD